MTHSIEFNIERSRKTLRKCGIDIEVQEHYTGKRIKVRHPRGDLLIPVGKEANPFLAGFASACCFVNHNFALLTEIGQLSHDRCSND